VCVAVYSCTRTCTLTLQRCTAVSIFGAVIDIQLIFISYYRTILYTTVGLVSYVSCVFSVSCVNYITQKLSSNPSGQNMWTSASNLARKSDRESLKNSFLVYTCCTVQEVHVQYSTCSRVHWWAWLLWSNTRASRKDLTRTEGHETSLRTLCAESSSGCDLASSGSRVWSFFFSFIWLAYLIRRCTTPAQLWIAGWELASPSKWQDLFSRSIRLADSDSSPRPVLRQRARAATLHTSDIRYEMSCEHLSLGLLLPFIPEIFC